jgi:hypothetical protein
MTAHCASDLPLPAPTAPVWGRVVYQKGRSSEPSVVSPALWLPEFDS